MSKKNIALVNLALTACVSTAFAQTNWLKDDFNGPILTWTPNGPGQIRLTNQQLVVSGSFGRMQTNNPVATSIGAYHTIGLPSGPLPDQQTLELRADLVGANQNDAWAGLHFLWSSVGGYALWKDQDEVVLHKFWSSAGSLVAAAFFYENRPVKNQNVTLVLALTRLGSEVRITTRVLDKDNANAVLFERTVTDTPQGDPVLPNRAVRGWIGVADLAGTPWPVVTSPTYVTFLLQWANPESATQGAAEVTFDNAEVWQYESPQLTIQNAVVLSWPLTQGQFVLESAPSVNGPWAPVPDPWWRTNAGQNQVSILAPDNLQLFRLRQ
jgi:hypothetical protein